MFTEQQLEVIHYCAQECMRQHSGEASVYHMVDAWNYAHLNRGERGITGPTKPLTIEFIEHIGKLVEPIRNQNGIRTVRIFVGNGWDNIEKDPPEVVVPHLEALLESYYEGLLNPMEGFYVGNNEKSQSAEDEFYLRYENIHPFVDGNGRSGKIIYNYLKGTLDNPVMPPNFWNGSNP